MVGAVLWCWVNTLQAFAAIIVGPAAQPVSGLIAAATASTCFLSPPPPLILCFELSQSPFWFASILAWCLGSLAQAALGDSASCQGGNILGMEVACVLVNCIFNINYYPLFTCGSWSVNPLGF